MKANEVFPSNFLSEPDLDDEDLILTIAHVGMEKLGDDQKLACSFKEHEKKLIINKTNFNAIVKATGEEDTDDWVGKKITLYPTEVQFKDKMVPAIRVKSKPPKAKAEKKKAEDEEVDDDDPPF
jgi:hypothetical protein